MKTRLCLYEKKNKITRSVTAKRSFLLGAGGLLAVTGSTWSGYPGAGALACIISAFVAATGWRRTLKVHNRNNPKISADGGGGTEQQENPVAGVFEHAWVILQPVLFAFIGTDLDFGLLMRGNTIVLGLLVLAFGLLVRFMFRKRCTTIFVKIILTRKYIDVE